MVGLVGTRASGLQRALTPPACCAENRGPRAEDDCELVGSNWSEARWHDAGGSERALREVCLDGAFQPVSGVGPDAAGSRRLVAKFAAKKLLAEGLVFSLKAGNKPAETADDPAAPGPYDAIHKNNQGDNRWAFRDGRY